MHPTSLSSLGWAICWEMCRNNSTNQRLWNGGRAWPRVNSAWPSNAIWQQRSQLTLVQVMASCLITNVNLSLNMFCGIHMRAISHEVPINITCKMCSEMYLHPTPPPPEDKELINNPHLENHKICVHYVVPCLFHWFALYTAQIQPMRWLSVAHNFQVKKSNVAGDIQSFCNIHSVARCLFDRFISYVAQIQSMRWQYVVHHF